MGGRPIVHVDSAIFEKSRAPPIFVEIAKFPFPGFHETRCAMRGFGKSQLPVSQRARDALPEFRKIREFHERATS